MRKLIPSLLILAALVAVLACLSYRGRADEIAYARYIARATADPSSAREGQVYANTTSHVPKFYNGTSWLTLQTTATTPGGSNTQLQYNNSGAFAGISGATSDGTNVTYGSGNLRATSPQFTTGYTIGSTVTASGSGITTTSSNFDITPGASNILRLGANGSNFWFVGTGGAFSAITDGGAAIGLTSGNRPSAVFISGPALTVGSGTGVTVNDSGSVRSLTYKVTVASTAFTCAATTCDVTVATLPAKTQITGVFADLTQVFACTATCTSSTLSFVFGRGSGGSQWLASFDADAATGQFGDADAELGTTMTRAAAIQGGSFENWSGTQAAVLRLTSGTGNIGNGSATNLSQGSVTLYLRTTVFP